MAAGSGAQGAWCWDTEGIVTALPQELKDEKIQLFMKYFDAKANEKIKEMEQAFGKLIDMVGSVLAVHLLKMPAAIKTMKLQDFLGKAPLSSNSPESKGRVKSTATKSCTVAKVSRTKSSSFSSHDKETRIRSGPKPDSEKTTVHHGTLLKKCLSDKKIGPKARQIHSRVNRSLPMIKIPLADGQAISAAGEEVNNIDVQSLDPQTLQGIQLLVNYSVGIAQVKQVPTGHATRSYPTVKHLTGNAP
ncbi:borealin-2-like [Rhinoraja longicauda]